MLKKIFFLSLMTMAALGNASDKMYIDKQEFSMDGDKFRIHIGHNVWLETDTVHNDKTGMYALYSSLHRSQGNNSYAYERTWKCPYCYSYWPIGKACQNEDCPSRYK